MLSCHFVGIPSELITTKPGRICETISPNHLWLYPHYILYTVYIYIIIYYHDIIIYPQFQIIKLCLHNHVKSPWLVSSCVHQAADHRRKVGEKLLQDHVDLWRLSARHAFGRNELRLSWREQRRQFPVPSEPTREQWEARIQDILVPRCSKDMARQCSKYFKMLKRYRFNMQNVLQRSQLVGNRILQHSDILRILKVYQASIEAGAWDAKVPSLGLSFSIAISMLLNLSKSSFPLKPALPPYQYYSS